MCVPPDFNPALARHVAGLTPRFVCLQDAQEFFLLLMNTIHENEQAEAIALSAADTQRAKVSAALKRVVDAHHSVGGGIPRVTSARHRRSMSMLSLEGGGGVGMSSPLFSSATSAAAFRNPFEGQQACSYLCNNCSVK